MRHRAPGVCNGALLTTDDDHYTSVLFPSRVWANKTSKANLPQGLLLSPHSTALHPHYMYSLTFHEKQSISSDEVKLQLLPHSLFFSSWL